MRKLFCSMAIFFLMVAVMGVSEIQAAVPAAGGPFVSAFQVQNLSTTLATCNYTLYDSAGTEVFTPTIPFTVNPGGGYQVYTPSVTGMPAGMFSAVVSCDQEVAAVSNFSDADSGASYKGITTGSDTAFVPALYNNYYGFYSNVVVQNITASPITVTLDIYAAGGTTPVKTQSKTGLASNASVAFDQQGLAGLNPNVIYSGKITTSAGGQVGAIVNYHGGVQLYSYNAFSSGSAIAYAPAIMNNFYGFNTSLTVQNIGTNAADVTVAYGVTGHDWTGTIQPNSSKELYTPNSGLPTGTNTGVKVSTATEPLVVLVNESSSNQKAASYSGFGSGGSVVKTPIVYKRYYNYNTSITCQNLGVAPTQMKLEYGGVATTKTSDPVDPGKTQLFYQPDDAFIPNGFNGSATITSLAGEPIVCVVNESINEGALANQTRDSLYAYEGIF
jgi:hypothetical protein